jgi:hypothetical protein
VIFISITRGPGSATSYIMYRNSGGGGSQIPRMLAVVQWAESLVNPLLLLLSSTSFVADFVGTKLTRRFRRFRNCAKRQANFETSEVLVKVRQK